MTRITEGITYELTYKKVKNLNLRVAADGSVRVSASRRVSVEEIDRFVASRILWINRIRERLALRETVLPAAYTDAECMEAFTRVSDRIYPLFSDRIGSKPQIRVRWMKSRWGVCHIRGRYITLNKQLMGKPPEALEYVVMHEYVHFLHPDHQAGFHAEMARLMPDYRERRAMLK